MTTHRYLFEDLLGAGTREQVARCLARKGDALGYEFQIYAPVASDKGEDRVMPDAPRILDRAQLFQRNVLTTYPDAWLRRYQEARHEARDPVIKSLSTSALPVDWDGMKGRHVVLDEAREHGLAGGITVSVTASGGQRALLSLATGRPPERGAVDHAAAGLVLLTALHVHEALQRIGQAPQPGALPQLTQRERECLQWAASGKTSWEISTILSISERTVIFHVGNATKKLNAANRRQAVVRALSLGLIDP